MKRKIDPWALVVWAVRDQRADQDDVGLHEIELQSFAGTYWRTSTCGCAAVSRIGAIGTAIDGAGQVRGVAPRMHPDAERVVDVLRTLKGASNILIYARLGETPSWEDAPRRLVRVENSDSANRRYKIRAFWGSEPSVSSLPRLGFPLLDRSGRRRFKDSYPGFEYRYPTDGETSRREVKIKECPLVEEPSYERIDSIQTQYRRWHAAMSEFCSEIRKKPLRDFEVTEFLAPPR